MDPEFQKFFDELGLPPIADLLVDEDPPEALDVDKLRAFHRGALSRSEAEWVAFLISRYRIWHEAEQRLALASLSEASAQAEAASRPKAERVDREKEPLTHQIGRYLALAYMDLLGQLPLFTPAAVHADLLAPYRPVLRRIVCEEWNWAHQRTNPDYRDLVRLAEAIAQALARHAAEFPFPPALLAAILVKEGLDDFCNLEDRDA